LLKSAGWLMGSFLGLNSFAKAFAMEKHRNHTVDQPRIALIIDDIGYSLSHARQFLNLSVECSHYFCHLATTGIFL